MLLRAPSPDKNIIQLNDFTVQVKPTARARSLTLRYHPKKSCFVVSVPKRISRKFIVEFLLEQEEWMTKQVITTPLPATALETGRILIEGNPREIIHTDAAGVEITLTDNAIHIACRETRLPRALQRYLVQRAQDIIAPLAQQKAALINRPISKITFRDTSSRWGSCAHDGSLSFSWRLIMAPQATIDYVVAHEVAHLQHFDHSEKFWNLCRELSAQYTTGKHWLKLNGSELQSVLIA